MPPNMNQPMIFLDLDGVLADFATHSPWGNKTTSADALKLDYKWWATIPAFAAAKAFYDEVCQLGTVRFLSGCAASEACFAGKAHWVQAFVSERGSILTDLILCQKTEKYFLARPDRILVDDSPDNIKAWEAAGGS